MANNQLFDLIAPHYDRLFRVPDARRIGELLELPASGWMLDAGGGTGRVSAQLRGQVDRLVISDLSGSMLRQAARKNDSRSEKLALPALSRVEQLPFADSAFSRILVVDAFHHFSDQEAAVRELARVLSPGGRLLIAEPDIALLPVKLIALGERVLLMGSRFRDAQWIHGMMRRSGLDARFEQQEATAWVIGIKGAAA